MFVYEQAKCTHYFTTNFGGLVVKALKVDVRDHRFESHRLLPREDFSPPSGGEVMKSKTYLIFLSLLQRDIRNIIIFFVFDFVVRR